MLALLKQHCTLAMDERCTLTMDRRLSPRKIFPMKFNTLIYLTFCQTTKFLPTKFNTRTVVTPAWYKLPQHRMMWLCHGVIDELLIIGRENETWRQAWASSLIIAPPRRNLWVTNLGCNCCQQDFLSREFNPVNNKLYFLVGASPTP